MIQVVEVNEMTDFQFKAIIKMVLTIARKTNDADAIIHELERLLPPDERTEEEEKSHART